MADQKKEYAGQDRRRQPRVAGAVVDYFLEGLEKIKETAFIKDISAGGICIYVYKKIATGEKMTLNIYLFGNKDPIVVKGEVVWQEVSDISGITIWGSSF